MSTAIWRSCMAMSIVRCLTLNSTHSSTASRQELRRLTSRQSRRPSAWLTRIACLPTPKSHQNGRPLPLLSGDPRPRKDFALCLNKAFTRLAMLKPGLDIMSGYSVSRQREHRDNAQIGKEAAVIVACEEVAIEVASHSNESPQSKNL